jgi:hypothetical protein
MHPSPSQDDPDDNRSPSRLKLIAETLGNFRSIGMTIIFIAVVSIVTVYIGKDILGHPGTKMVGLFIARRVPEAVDIVDFEGL